MMPKPGKPDDLGQAEDAGADFAEGGHDADHAGGADNEAQVVEGAGRRPLRRPATLSSSTQMPPTTSTPPPRPLKTDSIASQTVAACSGLVACRVTTVSIPTL